MPLTTVLTMSAILWASIKAAVKTCSSGFPLHSDNDKTYLWTMQDNDRMGNGKTINKSFTTILSVFFVTNLSFSLKQNKITKKSPGSLTLKTTRGGGKTKCLYLTPMLLPGTKLTLPPTRWNTTKQNKTHESSYSSSETLLAKGPPKDSSPACLNSRWPPFQPTLGDPYRDSSNNSMN